MDETYMNGNGRKTGSGFPRGNNGGGMNEKMRMSRMSVAYEGTSNDRITPIEVQRGANTGARANQSVAKFKVAPNLRQYSDSQQ